MKKFTTRYVDVHRYGRIHLLCKFDDGIWIRKVESRNTFRRYFLASSVLKEVVNSIF